MENENEILGFDPTQLSVFNENDAPKAQGNSLVYKTRPVDSVDEDHIYRSTIKIVYNPFNFKESILEQQSYWLEDAEGGFSVVSSLTNNDTNCPIFKAWKKCHFAKKDENPILWKQAAAEADGGNNLFDKRFTRYCVIQVLEDKNQPQLVNKYMFWKMPKSIYDLWLAKTKPTSKEKSPIPVMDYLFGRSIELEVTPGPGKPGDQRYTRETSYRGEWSEDVVSCVNVDGSPLLNDAEQDILDAHIAQLKKIWKEKNEETRKEMTDALNQNENTIALRQIYSRVLVEIKKVCPNLIESLGYKPWEDNVTARVQRWIDAVLAGKTPKLANATPGVIDTVGNDAPVATSTPVVNVPTETEAPADDLPF